MTRTNDSCKIMKVGLNQHVIAIIGEIQKSQWSQHSRMSWQQSCTLMPMLFETWICCNSYYWSCNGQVFETPPAFSPFIQFVFKCIHIMLLKRSYCFLIWSFIQTILNVHFNLLNHCPIVISISIKSFYLSKKEKRKKKLSLNHLSIK